MIKQSCVFLLSLCGLLHAADLKPDTSKEIPESGKRPPVLSLDKEHAHLVAPRADLPEGLELITVAAAPLVTHPIMGCLDETGRLFVGDATGVNWNKAQLEANPPNRVLMLEDTDHDGVFDRSTVFADKMTFPQGACWLNGSLYVCSPPGLWKLTDTDDDGIADKREMIVSGFDYTGNAADIHGPFLHPSGRLYWCHGRKGHKATGKDGTVVNEGLACGIWSCKPDGNDVQWHSLGCGDNPVEVDFTPEGDVIGVQNLYYTNPRGDTLVHWQPGGVYERADQMKAIEGLPRTLEHMPVIHNFGHVAVSGSCFARSGVLVPNDDLQFMVTYFNTQRVVRMELTPEGATYKAVENEFLTLHDPDIHITDVMEDKDGSLLVVNTGGWFRIGCPSSLMAKPDIAGAIYRVRPVKPRPVSYRLANYHPPTNEKEILALLASPDPMSKRRACEAAAAEEKASQDVSAEIKKLLSAKLDPALEHAVLHAAQNLTVVDLEDLKETTDPVALRRMFQCFQPEDGAGINLSVSLAAKNLDSSDSDLARVSLRLVTKNEEADTTVTPDLLKWLSAATASPEQVKAIEGYAMALAAKPETQKLITNMLGHSSLAIQNAALRVIAAQTGVTNKEWLPLLEKRLAEAAAGKGSLSLVFDAIKKLRDERFNKALQAIANDAKQTLALRLKALDAMKSGKLTPETFGLLQSVLSDSASSAAARIQAAFMLAASPLDNAQLAALAPQLATAGPVELKELVGILRKTKDAELANKMAAELAKNLSLISQQESVYRTALSAHPPEIFETIILPALRKAGEAIDAKKRLLVPLAEKVIATGDAAAGRAVYESGKGTCIACHQIGDKGRPIGPNLSHIGAIRTERDIVESILFPSNTLARDYEAHVIETRDGQGITGVIRSHTAEGLLVADVAGQERNIPQEQIVSDTQLATSLMPMGLDLTVAEKELVDLVAYLRSVK
ncbi:MAG: atsA 11 [Verrucomicrobiaceae bacterium]|nr:atsA 11 [Verrucomicrobiaceae bacterium]